MGGEEEVVGRGWRGRRGYERDRLDTPAKERLDDPGVGRLEVGEGGGYRSGECNEADA